MLTKAHSFTAAITAPTTAFSIIALLICSCSTRPNLGPGSGTDVTPPGLEAGQSGDSGINDGGLRGDLDGDGLHGDMDCDDSDAAVGATADRPCASTCATGMERCEMGVWSACDAPIECDCEPGETRTAPCGLCGIQTQSCEGRQWVNRGDCSDEGACTPGTMETGSACGRCGTQERSCTDRCAWPAWLCIDEGACAAGEIQTEIIPCGPCGVARSRTRTCGAACEWEDWSEFGECAMVPDPCEPRRTVTRACGMTTGTCTAGTQTRSCDGLCFWSEWSACSGETCDGRDNNCNGEVDEGLSRDDFDHCGDVNGDGRIDVTDVAVLMRLAAGISTPSECQRGAGDVASPGGVPSPDGIFTPDDARTVFGWYSSHTPCCLMCSDGRETCGDGC